MLKELLRMNYGARHRLHYKNDSRQPPCSQKLEFNKEILGWPIDHLYLHSNVTGNDFVYPTITSANLKNHEQPDHLLLQPAPK